MQIIQKHFSHNKYFSIDFKRWLFDDYVFSNERNDVVEFLEGIGNEIESVVFHSVLSFILRLLLLSLFLCFTLLLWLFLLFLLGCLLRGNFSLSSVDIACSVFFNSRSLELLFILRLSKLLVISFSCFWKRLDLLLLARDNLFKLLHLFRKNLNFLRWILMICSCMRI